MQSPSSLFWRRFFDKGSRDWYPYGLIAAVCVVLYLPGIAALPVIDRDEPMYAQSSKQMVEDGQYVRIQFGTQDRNKKPIGIYWLQVLSVKLFGVMSKIWVYRVPSLLGVLLASLATFWAGKELLRPPAALVAALLLPCSLLLEFVGHMAVTDAALLACVCVSQAALAGLYIRTVRSTQSRTLLLTFVFWLALGCGVLLKGPVILIAPLGTILAVRWKEGNFNSFSKLGLWWGIPLCILIVAPWMIAIQKATDGQFLRDSLGGDFWSKFTSANEGHHFFPGFYLLGLPLSFWPGIVVLAPALGLAWRKRSRQTAFLLGWIIPLWLVLEVIPTRLPHYILPVFPALALLCGEYCTSADRMIRGRWLKVLCWVMGIFGAVAPVVALVALEVFFWQTRGGSIYWPLLVLLIPALIFAVLTIYRYSQGRRLVLVAMAVIVSLIGVPVIYQYIIPAQDQIWINRRIGKEYTELTRLNNSLMKSRLVSVGLHQPSLVFYCGRDTILTSNVQIAADTMTINPATVLLVAEEFEQPLLDELNARGLYVEPENEIEGFNYDKGDFIRMRFYIRPWGGEENY